MTGVLKTIALSGFRRLAYQAGYRFTFAPVSPPNANNLFCFFGITKADYFRKPAFKTFQSHVQELGMQ